MPVIVSDPELFIKRRDRMTYIKVSTDITLCRKWLIKAFTDS